MNPNRREVLLSMSTVLMPQALPAATASPRFLHVGSYAPAGQGIYSFAFEPDGRLREIGLTQNPHSPSWLLADPATQRLYAAEEGGYAISVYRQDGQGRLTAEQRLASGGQGPVHLSLSAGRLWAAHYGDARFAGLPLQADGSLGSAVSWPSCRGPDCRPGPEQAARAPRGSRAGSGHDAAHAHMIQASPDGRWLLGTDLGRDRLLVWPLQVTLPPPPASELRLSPGSGPRHFVFHPSDASLVYVLQEESSTLSTVRLLPEGPQLLGEISVLPAGFAGTSYASDLVVAPGGSHLYALNRLYDSIAVLSIATPGQPRLVDHHWTHGSYPRNACVVGGALWISNQRSDHLSRFDLSRPDQPGYTGVQVPVPSPAGICVF